MSSVPLTQVLNAQAETLEARRDAQHARSNARDSNQAVLDLEAEVTRLKNENRRLRNDLDEASGSDEGLEVAIRAANNRVESLSRDVVELASANKEKDAIILEWMQSNGAFKQLARQYGKELGVTDEKRQEDFDNHLLNAVREDPRFADTQKTAGAKKRLGKE